MTPRSTDLCNAGRDAVLGGRHTDLALRDAGRVLSPNEVRSP
ncbi:MAG: hypothetical protein WCB67_11635 [Solirubrobacteraceae bacterium]